MKRITSTLIFLALLVVCSAQAAEPEKGEQANAAPAIDCSKAAEHIKSLTSEKERAAGLGENGADMLVPDYAVAPEFVGSGKDVFQMETNEYIQKLDAKIARIKQQCKLQ